MKPTYSDKAIRVDPNSATAGWVRFASRGRKTKLAALDINGKKGMAFVPDELFVHNSQPNLIRHLVHKYGAEIIPVAPLLQNIAGLEPKKGANAAGLPIPTRLRFKSVPGASANAAKLLREVYSEKVSVNSEMAAAVMGLVAELGAGGNQVGLNTVATPVSLPLFSAQEWWQAAGGFDPFKYPAYAGKARVAAAWQLLEAYKHFENLNPDVKIAILDG